MFSLEENGEGKWEGKWKAIREHLRSRAENNDTGEAIEDDLQKALDESGMIESKLNRIVDVELPDKFAEREFKHETEPYVGEWITPALFSVPAFEYMDYGGQRYNRPAGSTEEFKVPTQESRARGKQYYQDQAMLNLKHLDYLRDWPHDMHRKEVYHFELTVQKMSNYLPKDLVQLCMSFFSPCDLFFWLNLPRLEFRFEQILKKKYIKNIKK